MSILHEPNSQNLKKAAAVLKQGGLVAFPTETVYGLGADARNEQAVATLYRVKGRPQSHPAIVHISSNRFIAEWARDIPDYAYALAEKFWPGPMTLILPKTKLAKFFITGGQNSIGIRIPRNKICNSLLKEFEALGTSGVVAPSANLFGQVSTTKANLVVDSFANSKNTIDLIFDGGGCEIGIESTIIDCTGVKPSILRPGSITIKMIIDALHSTWGFKCLNLPNEQIKAPGKLVSHYSPKANLYLTGTPKNGDGFIAFKIIGTPKGVVRLAEPETIQEYARVLYDSLIKADRLGLKNIYAIPPIGQGLALAIKDRLRKAAN